MTQNLSETNLTQEEIAYFSENIEFRSVEGPFIALVVKGISTLGQIPHYISETLTRTNADIGLKPSDHIPGDYDPYDPY